MDTDVILDVLASRKPFASDSAAVLSLVESGKVEGFVAAHAVTTLFYLLRREVGAAKARSVLMDLTRDQGGFRGSPVPVLSPAEFVALHGRTVEET